MSIIGGEVDPYDEWLLLTGQHTIIMYTVLLLIGPIQRLFKLRNILWLKQPLGLSVFSYAFAHIVGYFALHAEVFNTALFQIIQIPFLWFGAISFVMLTVLAITSNQISMKFLRNKWKIVHKLALWAAVIGAAHGLTAQKTALSDIGIFTAILLIVVAYRGYEALTRRSRDG